MLGDSIVVRGPVGVGKSTTVFTVNELLVAAEVNHAVLDLDWLSASWPRFGPWNTGMRDANVRAVASTYRDARIRHFVVAGVIETREGLDHLREALGASRLSVCRLHAPVEVIAARLRGREDEQSLEWFLERAAVLDGLLEADGLDDVVVDATSPVREVAQQICSLLDWEHSPADRLG